MKTYQCKHGTIIEVSDSKIKLLSIPNPVTFRVNGGFTAICQHCVLELLVRENLVEEIKGESREEKEHWGP